MTPQFTFAIAAFLAGLAVLLGAFGAHGLSGVLQEPQMQTYQTATQYLMYHALALLGVAAVWLQHRSCKGLATAVVIMLLGIMLFSGSLYLLLLTGFSWLVWLTPLGGLTLIFSWVLLAWQGLKGFATKEK